MPNEIFRRRLVSAVLNAQRSFLDVAAVDHAGIRGRVREIVTGQLLSIVLPSQFKIGTGKIVDCNGAQSAETDVVVYNDSLLPSILYSERDGIFPVEACFLAMEVKSRLTAGELDDAIAKAARLRSLSYQSGMFNDEHEALPHELTPAINALFAFKSDLTGKSELDRYAERDPDWKSNPLLRAICVAGHGYWWFHSKKNRWFEHAPNQNSEEIVEFLALAANTVIHSSSRRGAPRLGKYLIGGDRPVKIVPM